MSSSVVASRTYKKYITGIAYAVERQVRLYHGLCADAPSGRRGSHQTLRAHAPATSSVACMVSIHT